MNGRERVAVGASVVSIGLTLAGAWIFLPAAIPGAVTLVRHFRRAESIPKEND